MENKPTITDITYNEEEKAFFVYFNDFTLIKRIDKTAKINSIKKVREMITNSKNEID